MNAGPSLPIDWGVGQGVQISLRMLTRAAGSSMLNLLIPNILQNINNTGYHLNLTFSKQCTNIYFRLRVGLV